MSTKCPFPPGSKVNGYLRDSGGDEQDLSVPQQEAVIREFCAQNSLELVHLFKDGARPGGSTVGREAFDRMLEHFLAGAKEAGLILWSFARFARNDIDATIYKSQLRKAGYQIYSMSDNLPEGIYGRLVEYILDFNNALFRESLSKEVKRGLRHLVREFGAMPGTPPLGFKREEIVIGQKRNGESRTASKWVIDEELAARIRMAWQMRAAGASYNVIHRTTRLYGSRNSYATFFRNPLYKGELHFEELVIPNYCEPLVEPEIWEAVQKRRKSTREQLKEDHPRRATSQFLLTGLVKCAVCGAPMNGEVINKGRHKRAWSYYLCNKRQRTATCTAERVPQKLLEDTILDDVINYVLQPETLRQLREHYEAGLEGEVEGLAERRAFLTGEIAKAQKRVSNLVRAIAETGHNNALVTELKNSQAQEKELQASLDELAHFVRPRPAPLDFEDLADVAQKLRDKLANETLQTQQAILKGLIQEIRVQRQKHEVQMEVTYYFFGAPGIGSSREDDSIYGLLHRGGTSLRWKGWTRTLSIHIK